MRPWSITDRNLVVDTHRARRRGFEFEANSAFIDAYPWARSYFDVYGNGQVKIGIVAPGNYFLRVSTFAEPCKVSITAAADGGERIYQGLSRDNLPDRIRPLLNKSLRNGEIEVEDHHYDDIRGTPTTYFTIEAWLNGVRHKLLFDEEPGFFVKVSLPGLQDQQFLVDKSLLLHSIEHYTDLLAKVKANPWPLIRPMLSRGEEEKTLALLKENRHIKCNA